MSNMYVLNFQGMLFTELKTEAASYVLWTSF